MKKRILACILACLLIASFGCSAMAERITVESPTGTLTIEMGESYAIEDVIRVVELLKAYPCLAPYGYFSLPDYLSGKYFGCTLPGCPYHPTIPEESKPIVPDSNKPVCNVKPLPYPHRHFYTRKIVEPTCTKAGYTVYTCVRCNLSYTADPVDRILHWFGAWMPNGNGTHSAACIRENCDHVAAIECGNASVILNDTEFTFCPVCGDTDDGDMKAIKASAKPVKGSNPRGDLVVLEMPLENDDILLSVTYEYSGRAESAEKAVKVTVPAEYADYTFMLIGADNTETEVAVKTTDNGIVFELDFTEIGKIAFLRLTLPVEESTETK